MWSVAFCPDNKTLASTSPDQTIRLWDIDSGKCKKVLHEDIGDSQLVAFSPDGQTLVSCNQNHNIKLWNIDNEKCFKILVGHEALISSIAFSSDNCTLVSSSEDETIKLWNIKSGECMQTLRVEKLYKSMNHDGVTGLTEATLDSLKTLGAIKGTTKTVD